MPIEAVRPPSVARGDEGIMREENAGGVAQGSPRVSRGGTGECGVRGFVGGSVHFRDVEDAESTGESMGRGFLDGRGGREKAN